MFLYHSGSGCDTGAVAQEMNTDRAKSPAANAANRRTMICFMLMLLYALCESCVFHAGLSRRHRSQRRRDNARRMGGRAFGVLARSIVSK
jgi:hypothetical protein